MSRSTTDDRTPVFRARRSRRAVAVVSLGAFATVALLSFLAGAGSGGGSGQVQVPTTDSDFFMPGTQPNASGVGFDPIVASNNCQFCHGEYSPTTAPYDSWVVSLMGQSARDPVFHAALAVANQDAHLAGEFCIRCHAPGAWLNGKSVTGDMSLFEGEDFDGVNCAFCHRAVNPVIGPDSAVGYPENDDPTPDVEILAALAAAGNLPDDRGNANYVVDPKNTRRGPYDDVPINFHGSVELVYSPFHTKGRFCGQCHDVSTPTYTKLADGTYALNSLGAPHPTAKADEMFPEQRTYSEWAASTFASMGVAFADRRFGGNTPDGVVSSCQDCHMPKQVGGGCIFFDGDPKYERDDIGQHSFSGANTWVMRAIRMAQGDEADNLGLTADRVEAATARNIQMLRDASDMELSREGPRLKVRIINQSGHKLPTGYVEGRRMWVNVRFLDAAGNLVAERGAYDYATATLDESSTKVYRADHAIDETIAKQVHLPPGTKFHLVLNNVVVLDNRIPPRGFTNAAFDAFGSGAVGYSYADGQHWDDTLYDIPAGARSAVVTFYAQTSSREYMEFLRDTNVTDGTGQTAYDLWVATGRSAPVDMDSATIDLSGGSVPGDLNGDGKVDGIDLTQLLANWGGSGSGDLNGDGAVDGLDLAVLLAAWSS
jgi:hypothetical protein